MEINQDGLRKANLELDAVVKQLVLRKVAQRELRGKIASETYALNTFNQHIKRVLEEANLLSSEAIVALEIPNATILADFTLKAPLLCTYSPEKDPQVLAYKIAEIIGTDDSLKEIILNVAVVGFYINIHCKRPYLSRLILDNILEFKNCYGDNDMFYEKKYLVDYSSPNTAKRMTIGHIRSTVIGGSVVRILDASGAVVYGINHLGDWGKQFGLLSLALEREEKKKGRDLLNQLETDPIETLGTLYVQINQEAKADPTTDEEARKRFAALEAGDPKQLTRWKQLREWSLLEFERMYQRMGISFDLYLGESFYEEMLEGVLNDCLQKDLAYENKDGTILVPFKRDTRKGKFYYIDKETVKHPELQKNVSKENGYEVLLIRKNDGSSLYSTRDLAALRYRKQTFHLDKIIYVVGNEQHSYLLQCFELARELGYIDGYEPEHVGFGLIKQNGEKMSSRKGNVFRLEELFDCAKEKVLDIFNADEQKTNLDVQVKMQAAEDIAVGAVVFGDLAQSREKDVEFNLDKILNMKEMSGPYIQYAAIRCGSILAKLEWNLDKSTEMTDDFWLQMVEEQIEESEWKLIKQLSLFPETVMAAGKTLKPHMIATYLFGLSQDFNFFYGETNVLRSKEPLKTFRAHLVWSVQQVFKNGLHLLCMKVPETM